MQANVSPGSLPDSGPLVSIVLPSYNGERFLARSIESCLNQTHRNIELILVDDGSVDSTWSIMQDYAGKDKRVIALRNAANSHIAASLNTGFGAASGDYFSWTSDDNYYEPTAIATMLATLRESGSDIVFAGMRNIDCDGNFLYEHMPCDDMEKIVIGNIVGACFLYSRALHDAVGGYDISKPLVEDFFFWLTAYTLGFRFVPLKAVLYTYMRHAASLTSTRQEGIANAHFDLIWEYRPLVRRCRRNVQRAFCERILEDAEKLRRGRLAVHVFVLRLSPWTYCAKGGVKFLKKILWNRLPSPMRMRIKTWLPCGSSGK